MKAVCKLIVLLLLFVLALAALGVAAFIGIGTLLARWLPMSLFQASALAIAATATIALIIQAFMTMLQLHMAHDVQDDDFGWLPVDEDDVPATPPATPFSKVGRNHPCPCGSGKKFKYCCGQSTPE
jgi:uncharacterized protein YchJ